MGSAEAHWGGKAFDFADGLDSLNTVEAVMDAMRDALAPAGVEFFCFSTFMRADQRFEDVMLAVRLPPEWFKIYLEEDYAHSDPFIRHCGRTFTPFELKDAPFDPDSEPKAVELVRRLADFKLSSGLVVPVPSPAGFEGIVWAGGYHFEATLPARRAIQLVALSAFERVRALAGVPRNREILTPREREVLTWVAQGKSAWEIGEILHIAKRTVDEHAQTAFRKLGAVNRAHAVAIAIRQRLIRI
jgi:LuxR family quorum sensing-dependent transcriptional regulator